MSNRDVLWVAFTVGRDILLEPRQAGEPLNFIIDPYAEVDGKPHRAVARELSFRSLQQSRP
ncbi:hypothetical protein ACFL09_07090 [Planctomycetota bacterium]